MSRLAAALLFAAPVAPLHAQFIVKLAPQTLDEFQAYVARVEAGMRERWGGRQPFLWLDENRDARQAARKGEIVVKAYGSQDGNPVTGGLVHDWLGAMFIPGVRMEQVESIIQDFDRHKKFYPEVIDSITLRREGSTVYGRWRLRKKKVLTVELNAELEVHQDSASPARWYTRSYTVLMREIANAGTPQEREMPDGHGHGFLWRLNAYWRLEQEPDGVFAECHTLSLSRDVPAGLGWIIRPIIRDLPRQSLIETMKATARAAKLP
ncbi:MAG: hypothetical protein HYX25_08365 [Candidatus Solibacter usitatus]|nr:hypothetical protein [Candidatus Solibacter usitatus]